METKFCIMACRKHFCKGHFHESAFSLPSMTVGSCNLFIDCLASSNTIRPLEISNANSI